MTATTDPARPALMGLDDPRATRVDVVGGKASALAAAVRAGLPVPPAWVVPTAARHADGPTPAQAAAWVAAAARLGTRVHVRSSSPHEDGAVHAHAGAYATVPAVAPVDVPDAVARVWASAGAPDAPMAVLVQASIAPRAAGVVFTVDPTRGTPDLVVEAVEGDGAGLVGGLQTPQRLVVRRPRRLRAAVTLQDQPGPVDTALRDRLVDLALRAEDLHSGPVDIEWAVDQADRLWLLQARPVTARARPTAGAGPTWTRRFLGERWSQPATPLGWSVVEPALAARIVHPRTQARHLGGSPLLRLVQGLPYVDARIFRGLLFKLPGLPPPRFLLELLPSQEAAAWRRRLAKAPDVGLVVSLLAEVVRERRWTRFAWNPVEVPAQWHALARDLRQALPHLAPPHADDAARVQAVEVHLAWLSDYVGVHVTSLLFANLAWQHLEGALQRSVPDRAAALLPALVACPEANQSVQQQQALARLAAAAVPGDLSALARGGATSPGFDRALAAFLAVHGHRAGSGWELTSPRWHEDPARLVPLLEAQGQATRAVPSGPTSEVALRELVQTAPAAHLPGLLAAVWWTRRYLLLRENQRHVFDALLDSLHAALRDVGAALARRGLLADAAEVRWLTWPEARQALTEGTTVAARVAARAAADAGWRAAPPPPVELDADPPRTGDVHALAGQGVSAGQVRGPVRVLHGLADARALRPGEVLVTRALEPAWAPVLAVAAGVIVELGGALSHGAVVARELGVPAVVDVADATRRLADGQEVTLDGTRGLVWVHDTVREGVKSAARRADEGGTLVRGLP
ncbi:MAG: hypothetical protein H6732_12550 [Alphaproteobacteria bacterium]|nr:hypothetical protein [Alphaproteobacteria bacterium]